MANNQALIRERLTQAAQILINLSSREITQIEKAALAVGKCLKKGGKLIICGNGGSAADAQHISAEFVNKFLIERKPLPAIALANNGSIVTSIANDYSFDEVFSRQIEAFGREGDILLIMTTSDISITRESHSANLGLAISVARQKKMTTIGLLSEKSNRAINMVNLPIIVPSQSTPRVQEVHLLVGHIICEIVEEYLSHNDQNSRKVGAS